MISKLPNHSTEQARSQRGAGGGRPTLQRNRPPLENPAPPHNVGQIFPETTYNSMYISSILVNPTFILLSFERELTNKFDLDEFVSRFAKSPRKLAL